MLNTIASAPAAPAAPVAPVFTLLQLIFSVVFTGAVTGTDSVPLSWPLPPRVELAAMAMVIGISLLVAEPLVTVMPVGAPLMVPTVGVVLVVPLYATTLQVTEVAAT